MTKEKQIISVQLTIAIIIVSYALTIFQNSFFTFSHKISHHIISLFEYPKTDHHHHNFLDLEQVTKQHTHHHNNIHKHEVLSFLKTVFNDNHSQKPYSNNKKKLKIDKHTIAKKHITNLELNLVVYHNYNFLNKFIPQTVHIILGPPPKLIVT